MPGIDSEKATVDDLIKEAELEKLKLETLQLRKNSKWGGGVTRYLPLLSVLVAIGGFLFGIYEFKKKSTEEQIKFLGEQTKDRETRKADQTIRIQSQVRSNLEQLYQFTQTKEQTISQVRFILGDLRTYLEIDKGLDAKSQAQRIRKITENLFASVKEDCDFDQLRDVQFVRTLMNDWEDSKPYLTEDTRINEHILIKYRDALRTIHETAPTNVRKLQYSGELFIHPDGYQKLKPNQIAHLQEIVWGSYKHMQLLEAGKVRERSIKSFQVASCNPTLTEQLFGTKIDEKDPDLHHCPKAK